MSASIEDPGPAEPTEPLAIEERIQLIEEKVEFIFGAHQHLFLLTKALGELAGIELIGRQVPDGMQFYWQRKSDKRIILPGRGN